VAKKNRVWFFSLFLTVFFLLGHCNVPLLRPSNFGGFSSCCQNSAFSPSLLPHNPLFMVRILWVPISTFETLGFPHMLGQPHFAAIRGTSVSLFRIPCFRSRPYYGIFISNIVPRILLPPPPPKSLLFWRFSRRSPSTAFFRHTIRWKKLDRNKDHPTGQLLHYAYHLHPAWFCLWMILIFRAYPFMIY